MVTPEEALKCAAVYEKAAADLRMFDSAQSNNYKMAAQALRDLASQVEELTKANNVWQDVYATVAEEVEALQAESNAYKEALQYAIWQHNGGGHPASNHWCANSMNVLAKFEARKQS